MRTSVAIAALMLCLSHVDAAVVVAAGDSLTNGYGKGRLSTELGDGYTRYTEAVGGITSNRYLNEGYAQAVVDLQPDHIALLLGTNNVTGANPSSDAWFDAYTTSMSTILDMFTGQTDAEVILMTVTPIIEPNAYAYKNYLIDDYVKPWLRDQAAARQNVTLLDVNALLRALPNWEQYLSYDGIHMWADNAAGYWWLADLVADTIKYPPGDFSGDGAVDADDLALVLGHWGASTIPTGWDAHWDNFVDADELADLLGNWGVGLAPSAYVTGTPAPEPMSITVMALCCMGITRRRQ